MAKTRRLFSYAVWLTNTTKHGSFNLINNRYNTACISGKQRVRVMPANQTSTSL